MRQQNRLGALQMGVARQDRINMASGKFHQNISQLEQVLDDDINRIPQIQAHIQCHLIVAASGGMQLAGNFTHDLCQPGFDMGVNIFQVVTVRKISVFDLLLYVFEAGDQFLGLCRGYNVRLRKGPAVRNAALNIIGIQAPVDIDRRGECFDNFRSFFLEPAGPHFFRHSAYRYSLLVIG